jgi:formylglycine-generating enzyme required for sulfatase activity
VDGRDYPWGDVEDASLACLRDARPGAPQPEPVGGFPTAASVYGRGDAAGGVWEWTDGWFDDRRMSRVLRGGAWNSQADAARTWQRYALAPSYRAPNVGFRCARSPA